MKNLIYVFLLLVFFYDCVEQKNINAVSRVEANRTLLDQVFAEGLKLHPCDNDTFKLKPIVDNVGITTTDTIKPKQGPIQPNEKPCIPDTIKIKTAKVFHDSIPYKVVDNQAMKIKDDTIAHQKEIIAFQAGQMSAKDVQIKAQDKQKLWLYGIISGLLALIVVYFGLKIYLSVTKIIPVIP